MSLLDTAKKYQPLFVEWRRHLHAHPELSGKEYETAAWIEKILDGFGVPHERMADTGVVATLQNGEGKTVALRADIDALPVTEITGLPFASENPGVMHACGHDIHTAALLGAVRVLLDCRDAFSGTVKFLFQPKEEGEGGARPMMDAGALEGVDAVFGFHVAPDLPTGVVGVRYGAFYAASNPFAFTVTGKSAHAARPEQAVDALRSAVDIISALNALPRDGFVLSVCTMNAGTAENVIADRAEVKGALRSLGTERRQAAVTLVRDTIRRVADAHGTPVDIRIRNGNVGVTNHDASSALVESAARELLGNDRVTVLDRPTMTTEDFGYYLEKTKGCFYHIGVGGGALHAADFRPDERMLSTAAAMHAGVVLKILEKTEK